MPWIRMVSSGEEKRRRGRVISSGSRGVLLWSVGGFRKGEAEGVRRAFFPTRDPLSRESLRPSVAFPGQAGQDRPGGQCRSSAGSDRSRFGSVGRSGDAGVRC